jgi:(S)-mandelate dehydrogenase
MSLSDEAIIDPSNHPTPNAPGWARTRAARARSIAQLRELAMRRLPRAMFDFVDGGAEDEITLVDNSAAYRRVGFMPKILVDASKVDTSATILGQRSPLPFSIGPTGAAGFLWPRGDLALARAAADASIPFALSTSASVSIEHLREREPGRLWFQAYIFKQRDFTEKMIRRALAADYETLIITVDFPVAGNRERDYRNDFAVPFRYTPRNVLDFARHPAWVYSILRYGFPEIANLKGFTPSNDTATVASSVGRNYDPSFAWDDLKTIRDLWPRKLLVKGVARPEEADRLVSLGVDAIAVSNHGGRQLDGSPATLDVLPGVAAAVAGRAEVLVDGGIRRGSDIVKALAMGANSVLIGRATLYGLAVAGQTGAARALTILREEMTRTMQLCGVTTISEIDETILRRP